MHFSKLTAILLLTIGLAAAIPDVAADAARANAGGSSNAASENSEGSDYGSEAAKAKSDALGAKNPASNNEIETMDTQNGNIVLKNGGSADELSEMSTDKAGGREGTKIAATYGGSEMGGTNGAGSDNEDIQGGNPGHGGNKGVYHGRPVGGKDGGKWKQGNHGGNHPHWGKGGE